MKTHPPTKLKATGKIINKAVLLETPDVKVLKLRWTRISNGMRYEGYKMRCFDH